MPLMVDPSSGARLYGLNVSVYTFVASTTITASPTTLAKADASSPITLAASVPSGRNMTQILADQAAQQAGMDGERARRPCRRES